MFSLFENSGNWVMEGNVDIKFSKSCWENDLCSTFLRYKMPFKRLENFESNRDSQRLLLQDCI